MASPEDNSFIVVHRKIMQWEWYTDTNTKCLFIHLLLLANHKQTKWRGEMVERGQILTGRKRLSEELNLSEKQIRVSLNKLKRTGEVAIKTASKYSVITLCNYSAYQDKKERKGPAERPADGPSEGQQGATSNNDNNVNKKNTSYEVYGREQERVRFSAPTKQETSEFFMSHGSSNEEAGKFWYHFDANGWKVGGRAPMKNWQSAARKWILNSKTYGGSNGQRINGTLKHQQPITPADLPAITQSIIDDPRYA